MLFVVGSVETKSTVLINAGLKTIVPFVPSSPFALSLTPARVVVIPVKFRVSVSIKIIPPPPPPPLTFPPFPPLAEIVPLPNSLFILRLIDPPEPPPAAFP